MSWGLAAAPSTARQAQGAAPQSPTAFTPTPAPSEEFTQLPCQKPKLSRNPSPVVLNYSSPTPCEKYPTFTETIPAEFYCLRLLIKHALRESKCLKSFASTKQLPHYPECNSDSLNISSDCNSRGTTTALSLHSSSNSHTLMSHRRPQPRKSSQFSSKPAQC